MTNRTLTLGTTGMAAVFIAVFTLAPSRVARADMDADDEFAKMDTNGDGKLSPEEFVTGHKAKFAKMDTNGDGKISVDELKSAEEHQKKMGKVPTPALQEMIVEKLKMMDTNGDGYISEDEFDAAAKIRFDKWDTNHDGYLSKAELKAGHEKMKAKVHEKMQEK